LTSCDKNRFAANSYEATRIPYIETTQIFFKIAFHSKNPFSKEGWSKKIEEQERPEYTPVL